MNCDVTRANSIVSITPLESRLDLHVADAFRDAMMKQIDDGVRCLVVNMEHVQSIDSSGLGALIAVLRRLGRDGGLSVCGLTPRVKSVFEIARLHRVIPVADRRTTEAVKDAPTPVTGATAA